MTDDNIGDIINGNAFVEYVGNLYECIAVYGDRFILQDTCSDHHVELTLNRLMNESEICYYDEISKSPTGN